MSILQQKRVLKLNASWQPYEITSVQEAIIAMNRQRQRHYAENMKRPYYALHIEYPVIDNQVDYSQPLTMIPVIWKDWVRLPVRFFDSFITTPNTQIRCPSIIIANNYRSIPKRETKFSKRAVRERDGNRCQYSGELVTEATGDLDHVMPVDLGGKTNFENLTTSLKEVNRLKSNMPLDEFLKKFPQYKRPRPYRPKAKQIEIVNTYGINDWDLFLKKE